MQPGDAATWAGVVAALIVGALGFLTGVIGLVIAGLARSDSRKANRIADEANGIAREANAISRTNAEQANETSDVRWDVAWVAPGRAQVRNVGRDQANEVRGEVTVDGVTQRFDADQVEAGSGPLLEFPEAAGALRREARERAAEEDRRRSGASWLAFNPSQLSPTHGQNHSVGWTINWRTALGRPQQDDQWHSMTSVEPE